MVAKNSTLRDVASSSGETPPISHIVFSLAHANHSDQLLVTILQDLHRLHDFTRIPYGCIDDPLVLGEIAITSITRREEPRLRWLVQRYRRVLRVDLATASQMRATESTAADPIPASNNQGETYEAAPAHGEESTRSDDEDTFDRAIQEAVRSSHHTLERGLGTPPLRPQQNMARLPNASRIHLPSMLNRKRRLIRNLDEPAR